MILAYSAIIGTLNDMSTNLSHMTSAHVLQFIAGGGCDRAGEFGDRGPSDLRLDEKRNGD